MVCYYVNYDLDAVLVSLFAERLKLVATAKFVANVKVGRLIEPVPSAGSIVALKRRSLNARIAGCRDVRQLSLDVTELPVEAVENITVFNRIGKAVITGSCRCVDRTGLIIYRCSRS